MPAAAARFVLRLPLLALIVLVVVALRAGEAAAPAKPIVRLKGPATWSNPVIAADFPDPSVVRDGERYWATSTSSAAAPGFPLMTSTDLVHWEAAGTIFQQLPGWASDSFWAPEIYLDSGGVRFYYSARKRGGRMCVAVATAPTIAGPYTDRGPLICQPAGSIDPTRTHDQYGRLFLIWKEDGNAVRRPSRIWRQRLTPDGLRLVGRPVMMLRSRARWEAGVVEAPSIVVHGAWTYLFHSGNSYGMPTCGYAMGVARARSLKGPFIRYRRNPILHSERDWRCPGHASFVTDDDDTTFAMYHAYSSARPTARLGMLSAVRWGADGWPAIP